MVCETPQNAVGRRVGEEFILLVGRPEVVMGDRAVVELDGGLVVFWDENRFVVAHDLTNPDIIVVIGIFDDLSGFPRLGFSIERLLRDFCEAIPVIPFVKFAVSGIGFGNPVSFGVVRVSIVSVRS